MRNIWLTEKKASHKRQRLSIEGGSARPSVSPSNLEHTSASDLSLTPPTSKPQPKSQDPASNPNPQYPHLPTQSPPAEDPSPYQVEYVDVTAEVERRLHESRLRSLMDTPATSQKRKFEALEDNNRGGEEEGEDSREAIFEERSPVKKQKTFGQLEGVLKGPGRGAKREFSSGGTRLDGGGSGSKRRRM